MDTEFMPGDPGVHDIGVFKPFIEAIASEEEQEHTLITIHNLCNLNFYVYEYAAFVDLHRHAVSLCGEVMQQPKSHRRTHELAKLKAWDDAAGREAAMLVFHLGKNIAGIRGGLHRTATLKASVDLDSLRKAEKQFHKGFPNYEGGRNAAGHRAELVLSMDEIRKHGVEEGGRKRLLFPRMDGDDFVATFRGKPSRLSLTDDVTAEIKEIVSLIYAGFPKLSGLLPPI